MSGIRDVYTEPHSLYLPEITTTHSHGIATLCGTIGVTLYVPFLEAITVRVIIRQTWTITTLSITNILHAYQPIIFLHMCIVPFLWRHDIVALQHIMTKNPIIVYNKKVGKGCILYFLFTLYTVPFLTTAY